MNQLNEILQLLQTHNLWQPSYTIKLNPNRRGQSISYFICTKSGTPIFIAKFFDHFKGVTIPESIDVLRCSTPEELIDRLSDSADFMDNIEEVSNAVYYQKRSFQRYVQVSLMENSVFPQIFCYKDNIILNNHFHGLLVEEAINGITLESHLRVPTSSCNIVDFAIDFLRKMADIIEKFIKHDIVHRDLSPDNIMIRNKDFLVIDPGMVKIVDRNTTQLGYMMGKKTYASPEQYYGLAVNADFTSDLYTIGLITFEIISGINPLAHYINSGDTHPHETIINKFDRDLEDIFFKRIDDSEQTQKLFHVIRKLLQPNKAYRFDNISTLQEAIQIIKEAE